MTQIVLFHHAQGLTSGLVALADRLEAAGHTVHLPDVYDGATFADLESGIEHAQSIGFAHLLEDAVAATEGLPADVVYLGISLGVMPAQQLAQNRPGALAAVLVGSAVPAEEFGSWPVGLPLQIHGMDADPVFVGEGDVEAARELVEAVPDGELFLYPGDRHLFVDASLPAYDEDAAALLRERVLAFLDRVG